MGSEGGVGGAVAWTATAAEQVDSTAQGMAVAVALVRKEGGGEAAYPETPAAILVERAGSPVERVVTSV